MKHGKLIAWLFGLTLFLFTVYAALDTFVLTRVYQTVETASSGSASSNAGTSAADAGTENAETQSNGKSRRKSSSSSETAQSGLTQTLSKAAVTDESYDDGNIKITLSTYREYDTTIYVADVQLASAEYLKTAFAQNAYGRNVTATTSDTAELAGAILAVNGDYYGAQESGYVLRNGILYRSSAKKNQEDLVIYEGGSFEIITETEVSAQELLDRGAVQILSFGPALVEGGKVAVEEGEEVGKAMASNPRTAIAVVDELHYLFIVSDGRTDESEGLSLWQLAEFAASLGAETVYNLDGGGSSAMVFNGELINNPTTSGNSIKERKVSDIVYIGY